jgi:hypothetical protein
MAGNRLGIAVAVDDGGAVTKIRNISGAFDKLGGPGSGASLFGNVGAKAVAFGFNLIADAASGTIGFLRGAVDAAMADQASMALLAQSLKNNIPNWDGSTAAIDAYTEAQIKRGFEDDATRASIAQLVGVTHDQTEAMNLTTLAEDLARAKGIDLATATDIVTKAHQGNSKALKALGIDVKAGATAAETLDAIQQNVKGSADRWNDTMSGRLNKSQVAFNEAVEKIGYTLLPVLASLMDQIANQWLPAFGRGWDKVRPIVLGVAGAIGAVVGVIQRVINWIGTMIGALGRGIAKLQAFIDKLTHLISIKRDVGHDPIGDFIFGGGGGGGTKTPIQTSGAMYGHSHDIYMDGRKVAEAVSQRQFYDLRRAALSSKV